MKALLVVNENAGRARKLRTPRLIALLEAAGLQPTAVSTAHPEEAAAAVYDVLTQSPPAYQRIIAAGGDGTIHSILPAFVQAAKDGAPVQTPLAILPVGSVNVLARELGIPLALPEAIKTIVEGAPCPVDIGIFNDHPFILMAGLGYDGAVVGNVQHREKRYLGVVTYVLEGLRLFFTNPACSFRISCSDDERELCSWQITVANASSYTYGQTFAPQARMDDGQLEVCAIPEKGRLARIWQTLAILHSKPHLADVVYFSGQKIEIACERPVAVQLDGDPAPAITKATISLLPHAVRVVVNSGRA